MKIPHWQVMVGVLGVLGINSPAQSLPAVDPEIVELPKFLVQGARELPPPESWRYARLPQFEVLSNTGNRETESLLRELQVFHSALEVVWPTLRGPKGKPVTLVLCAHEREFVAFKPANSGEVASFQGMGSIFLHGDNGAAIVLRTAGAELNIETPTATGNMFPGLSGIPTSGIRLEPQKLIYHDYTHFLLSGVSPRLPAWFEEGLAQILMGMTVTEKGIELAKLEDPNLITIDEFNAIAAYFPEVATTRWIDEKMMRELLAETTPLINAEDSGFQFSLHKAKLMSFPELFAVPRDSALARNMVGGAWGKQAHAFVHLCLYGENKRYQPGLLKFVSRLADEPVSEALFKDCFGVGYSEMDSILRLYLNNAAYTALKWNLKKGEAGLPKPAPVALREATQAEVGRIKGETLLMAGKVEAAGDELYAAYRRGERDPQLIEAIGLFDAAHGDRQRAAQFLAAAIAADTSSLPVYVSLARLRLDAALAHASPDGLISPAEVDQVAVPLRQAADRKLVSPELFELLAEAWRHSAEKISREDAVLLIRGALTYPNRLLLTYRAASAAHDAGLAAEASAFVDRGLKLSASDKERALFQELKTSFESSP